MKRNLQLFIGDKCADIGDDTYVLLNWSNGDLTEPAQIKNSWSRQITLPGTPGNDIIFGLIHRHDRVTAYRGATGENGMYFDPSVRTPFQIFDDTGTLVESGYLKLDEIVREGAAHSFRATLFGGLGGFLFALSFDAFGNRRSLADLVYKSRGGAVQDLGFNINQDTVLAAWSFLSGHTDPHYLADDKWDFINFAPAYNGIPKGSFSANKAIANVYSTGIPSSVDGYTPLGGGAEVLISFTGAKTEWEVRDLRSYLQRPVIRLGAILAAIADPENNGGYDVDLDETIFDPVLADNPYVWDTWLTLPLLTTMQFHRGGTASAFSVAVGNNTLPHSLGAEASYHVEIVPKIGPGSGTRYLWSEIGDKTLANYITVTVNFYNSGDTLLRTNTFRFGPRLADDPVQRLKLTHQGEFDATGAWTGGPAVLDWTNDGLAASFTRMEVVVTDGGISYGSHNPTTFPGWVWTQPGDFSSHEAYTDTPQCSGSYNMSAVDAARSYVDVRAADLLRTEHTPAEYLISFCKMLNLRMTYDPARKKVTIGRYFGRTVVDISRRINRSKPMTTAPIAFDKRWYAFSQDYSRGEWAQYYAAIHGRTFGEQRVDTGYDFDAGTHDVMSGIVFRGAVQILESSKYFCRGALGALYVPGAFFDAGSTYQLFDASGAAQSFDLPYPTGIHDYANRTGYPYFDVMDKPQFHGEGNAPFDERDTLLFFVGMDAGVAGGEYRVTDDTATMMGLNANTPCWDLSGGTALSEIPQFSRYGDRYNNVFYNSLDFGMPAEIPIPGIDFADLPVTIYARYWEAFIGDRLDVDTCVVRCHVNLDGFQVGQDLLKQFYYFDGAVWSLNKIINYSLTTWDDTECEFVRVQSINNYY